MKFIMFLLSFIIYSSTCFAQSIENPVISQFKTEAKKLGYKDWQIKIAISIYIDVKKDASLDQFIAQNNLQGKPLDQANCSMHYIMHVDDDINVFVPALKEIVVIKGYAFNKHNHNNAKPKNKTVGFYKCAEQKLVELPILFAQLDR